MRRCVTRQLAGPLHFRSPTTGTFTVSFAHKYTLPILPPPLNLLLYGSKLGGDYFGLMHTCIIIIKKKEYSLYHRVVTIYTYIHDTLNKSQMEWKGSKEILDRVP